MPTITRLTRQKNNQERVNVYLDGDFAFGLNEVDAAPLRTGQTLDEMQIAELRHKDAIAKAFDKAVTLLSYRPRSTQEIRDKLQAKSYADVVIDVVTERLTRMGYLDDRQFARFWIEDRNRFKPRGERALRYELRRKGIADAIISELLADMVDEPSAAYSAAHKRVRRMRGKTRYEFKQKIGSFLQRRGFGYSAANQAVETLIEELDADDPHFFAEPEQEHERDWD